MAEYVGSRASRSDSPTLGSWDRDRDRDMDMEGGRQAEGEAEEGMTNGQIYPSIPPSSTFL